MKGKQKHSSYPTFKIRLTVKFTIEQRKCFALETFCNKNWLAGMHKFNGHRKKLLGWFFGYFQHGLKFGNFEFIFLVLENMLRLIFFLIVGDAGEIEICEVKQILLHQNHCRLLANLSSFSYRELAVLLTGPISIEIKFLKEIFLSLLSNFRIKIQTEKLFQVTFKTPKCFSVTDIDTHLSQKNFILRQLKTQHMRIPSSKAFRWQ